MGFFTRTAINALSIQDPSSPLQPGSWLLEALGATASDAGINVTAQNAMGQPALLSSVRVLIETLGTMPCNVHQRLPKGTRLAPEHRMFPILNMSPNPHMSQTVWIQSFFAQVLLWGNGFCVIQRDRANRPVGLWPFPSDRTHARVRNSKLEYVTTALSDVGLETTFDPEDILFVPFLALDGISGINPIQQAKQAIGVSIAAERLGALFFGRGSRPSGVLEHPSKLSKEAKQNLTRTWQEATSGSHAMSVMLLEEGLKFNPMMVNPKDAQFLETRKMQAEEIARMFRVPPHMIGLLERSTHSNIEQQSLEFVIYTMLPWVTKFEQELNRKLFAGTNYYCKFNVDGLLRGDFQSRTQGYQILRNAGIISANDARAAEGWNLIPEDEGGDIYLAPLNMVPLYALANATVDTDPTPGGDDGAAEDAGTENLTRDRYRMAFASLFSDSVGRSLHRTERDQKTMARIWLPVLTSLAESIGAMVGKQKVSDDTHTFLAGYVGTLAHRSKDWMKDDKQTITTQEFDRAFQALMEQI